MENSQENLVALKINLDELKRVSCLSQKNPDTLLEEEKLELTDLQVKLDELYSQKAKGAFIRSRTRWLKEGEQNSHYFFNLEKQHSNKNKINKLSINGDVTADHIAISNFCNNFYQTLYSSKFSQTSADTFLNSLTVKSIGEDERELCDKHIILEILYL